MRVKYISVVIIIIRECWSFQMIFERCSSKFIILTREQMPELRKNKHTCSSLSQESSSNEENSWAELQINVILHSRSHRADINFVAYILTD